ncbi:hypothetical protein F4821DRAFT_279282 [Hypoxylon rubiginosum]|uniref:Uncharacterized protein n=1 Tax=Hypoxylon rubiginosum TaxID=110542 RepID=A0ACC0CYW8_9PEZI|nr:hypothetical protein F4821DRAFT_279282 [Hypoxylon rubiginosum]
MSSTNQETPGRQRPPLTFGVELEFLVPYLYEGEPDVHRDIVGLPPPIRLPRGLTGNQTDEAIHGAIRDLFRDNKIPVDLQPIPYKSDFERDALHRNSVWIVTNDLTIEEHSESDSKFVGVEINGPVELDEPEAFRVINHVREVLLRNVRVRVNPSCGLHVHVGTGSERFTPSSLRRICSLVWAAEHLLVKLNHPSRTINDTCKPRRYYSNISGHANGTPTEGEEGPDHTIPEQNIDMICHDYLGADVRHGEELTSFREKNVSYRRGLSYYTADYSGAFVNARREGGYLPFQVGRSPKAKGKDYDMLEPDQEIEFRLRQYSRSASNPPSNPTLDEEELAKLPYTRTLRRIVNTPLTAEQRQRYVDFLEMYLGIVHLESEGVRKFPDPGVFEGVDRLYNGQSSCEIAFWIGPRHAEWVSLAAYNCSNIREEKRTIEFRGAEASLSDWVTTWARICIGLVRFATSAPADDFMKVLDKCDRSVKEQGVYDVIDFIVDIGLPAEAALAEKHLQENFEEFGLEFAAPHEPDPEPQGSESGDSEDSELEAEGLTFITVGNY